MTDTMEPPLSQQLSRIDEPMERKRVGDMTITKWAGLTFSEYREAIEFAKLMSQARNSIPVYLKQNPGDCLAIITQSLRWRLEPYWVAQHSYVAREESLIAYDSAVHAAIVLSSGLIKGRPIYIYNGGGEERTCTVMCEVAGQQLSYTTPPLAKARPARNEKGTVKGSPLWDRDPDQQLGYYAMRNWGRRHAPELLGGVYDKDEFDETTQEVVEAAPQSPNLAERLPTRIEGTKGFQENIVDQGLAREAKLTEQLRQSVAAEEAAKAQLAQAQEATGEAAGEATAEGGGEVAPKAETPTSKPANGGEMKPKTAEEYMAYAAKWIEVLADPDELEARWESQKELRAKLGVGVSIRKRLEGMLRARVNELRQPPKKRV